MYVSVWVSRVSIWAPLYGNCNSRLSRQGPFLTTSPVAWYAKHAQWLVGNSTHGTFLPFPPTFVSAPLELFFTHIPTYVTCGGWIRECEYIHSDVYGPQELFVSVYVVSMCVTGVPLNIIAFSLPGYTQWCLN